MFAESPDSSSLLPLESKKFARALVFDFPAFLDDLSGNLVLVCFFSKLFLQNVSFHPRESFVLDSEGNLK